MFDVCVWGYMFPGIKVDNENEAKTIACNEYYDITGIPAYTDDPHVVWKVSSEYPYEWR